MSDFKLLSLILDDKNRFKLRSEKLLMENTFMQRTSGGTNLWKTQIGVTENYIVFLKCEAFLGLGSSRETEPRRILIHTAPMNSLKVTKRPRRKLDVLFPNGCTSHFKLQRRRGCGTAWTEWRDIETLCRKDDQKLPSNWTLITYEELPQKAQVILTEEKFMRPVDTLLKGTLLLLGKIQLGEECARSGTYRSKQIPEKKNYDWIMQREDYGRKRVAKFQEITRCDENGETSPKKCKKASIPKTVGEMQELEPVIKKTRLVRRFGEGIPDGCTFDLSMSCDDSSKKKPARQQSSTNPPPRQQGTRLDSSEHLSEKKYPSRTAQTVHAVKGSTDRLFDGRSAEQLKSLKTSIQQTTAILSHTPHNAESGFFPYPPEDEKEPEKVQEMPNRRCVEKKTLQQNSSCTFDEKRQFDAVNRLEESLKNEKRKVKKVSDKDLRSTPAVLGNFPSIPSLLFPPAMQRSHSANSLIPICRHTLHTYLTANFSLPNLDELGLYRRSNRLSYTREFEEKGGNLCPVSFWIPQSGKGEFQGRIYTASILSRKSEALLTQKGLFRSRAAVSPVKKFNVHTRTWSHSDSNGSRKSVSRSLLELLYAATASEYDSEGLESRHSITSDDTAIVADKILQTMEEQYPAHHSLWVDSPDMKKDVRQQSMRRSKDMKKDVGRQSMKRSTDMKDKTSSIVVEQIDDGKMIKRATEINQIVVARELRIVQQKMFCEMENGEIVRLMLKPHTVTEINCPHLCGYLYFFERTRNLVISELLRETEEEHRAEVIAYFAEVAFYCCKLGDKQSTYAILGGLCSPLIIKSPMAWSLFFKNYVIELRMLADILRMYKKESRVPSSEKEIPFFKSFLYFLWKALQQRQECNAIPRSRNLLSMLSKWIRGQDKQTFMNRIFISLYNAATDRSQWNSQRSGNRRRLEQPLVLYSMNLNDVLNIVEEYRMHFSFEIQLSELDEDTRQFLFFKCHGDVRIT